MGKVYVLKLEEDKWYVGFTEDFDARMEKHNTGQGSDWTTKYKPVEVALVEDGNKRTETLLTAALVAKHGIENVRGGYFAGVELSERGIKELTANAEGMSLFLDAYNKHK